MQTGLPDPTDFLNGFCDSFFPSPMTHITPYCAAPSPFSMNSLTRDQIQNWAQITLSKCSQTSKRWSTAYGKNAFKGCSLYSPNTMLLQEHMHFFAAVTNMHKKSEEYLHYQRHWCATISGQLLFHGIQYSRTVCLNDGFERACMNWASGILPLGFAAQFPVILSNTNLLHHNKLN